MLIEANLANSLKTEFKNFFGNSTDPENPYYIDPYKSDGSLELPEIINIQIEAKLDLFSTKLAQIITSYIKTAIVNTGITVTGTSVSGGAVTAATTAPGTVS